MRKIVLSATALIALSITSSAQVRAGLRAGANIASLRATVDNVSASTDTKLGIYAGPTINAPISATGLSFQTEFVYSMEGGKEHGNDTKINLSYLNIPVLLQYNHSGFFIETGPQLGVLLAAKGVENDRSVDIKEGFETTNFSWTMGSGFQSPEVGISFRCNFGLSNVVKTTSTEEGKLKANTIQIGLLIPFKGTGKAK